MALATVTGNSFESNAIQPYSENPHYWQYKGKPVYLIGGSDDDNLFQWPKDELIEHLDRMQAAGANYIRNTMSSRIDRGFEMQAYAALDGTYDLARWNDTYWAHFETLLDETARRDIVVQIEVWDSWDFYSGSGTWAVHPYNPKKNVNYSAEEIGLPTDIDYLPYQKVQPFFTSVPELGYNKKLLQYQETYVDKILSYALSQDHVLYAMNNETCADKLWGQHWAKYIRQKAQEAGRRVYLSDMFDSWDPTDGNVAGAVVQDPEHHPFNHAYYRTATPSNTIAHPEIYDFIDISNHNVQTGETHYQTGRYVIDQVDRSGIIRPVTCVKIYGGPADTFWDGTPVDGQERFWRNVFAGISSVRFHRPSAGLGFRSLRMFTDSVSVFDCRPCHEHLGNREANEAYCLASTNEDTFSVYFPGGGEVVLQLGEGFSEGSTTWLDIEGCAWSEGEGFGGGQSVRLKTPRDGHWVAVVRGRI